MITILKIFWNNTSLVSFHEFKIRECRNTYDYLVRIIAHVIVLLFFLGIFVIGFGFTCIGIIDFMTEDWKGGLIVLIFMLPLVSLGTLVWYQYVMTSIKEIRNNYLLWRKK